MGKSTILWVKILSLHAEVYLARTGKSDSPVHSRYVQVIATYVLSSPIAL